MKVKVLINICRDFEFCSADSHHQKWKDVAPMKISEVEHEDVRYFKKLSQLTVIMFALYLDCVWLLVLCIDMIMRSKSVICERFQRIQTWNVVVNLPHWTVMDWDNDIFSGGGISIIARGSCIYQRSLWLAILHLFSLEVVLVSSPGGLSLLYSLWSYMMTLISCLRGEAVR